MPNELNNRTDRYIFLDEIILSFFAHHKRYPFGKNATPVCGVKTYQRISLFGDNLESAFFGAWLRLRTFFNADRRRKYE